MLSPVNEIHDWGSKLKRRLCRKAATFLEKYPARETFWEKWQILDDILFSENRFVTVLFTCVMHPNYF